jgi:2-phospho-L-lactate guanylyltransferase
VHWRVILPLKPTGLAKTRLREATGTTARHAELVQAIQLDTLQAVLDADAPISGVHVIGRTAIFGDGVPGRVYLTPDPPDGLNAAIEHAAADIRRGWPSAGVIVLVADLPALRPADVTAVLQAAAQHDRGVVLDAAGTGTTMLTARPGTELAPDYGEGSAARHRRGGAVELPAPLGARTDVDTAEDLRRCLQLGVGIHTARMVSHLV